MSILACGAFQDSSELEDSLGSGNSLLESSTDCLSVGVEDVVEDYEDNIYRADESYKGKCLEMVVRVGLSEEREQVALTEPNNQYFLGLGPGFITCKWRGSGKSELASLTSGGVYTVRGKGDKWFPGSLENQSLSSVFEMKDCGLSPVQKTGAYYFSTGYFDPKRGSTLLELDYVLGPQSRFKVEALPEGCGIKGSDGPVYNQFRRGFEKYVLTPERQTLHFAGTARDGKYWILKNTAWWQE